jgi:glutaredoxin-dependent peroxiredoxin
LNYFCLSFTIKEESMRFRLGVVMLSAFLATVALAQSGPAPKVGELAPDFLLPYATKDSIARSPIELSKVIGRRAIILAFYPADWSSGCTKEMCTMRDDFSDLSSLNAELLPISGDYVFAHHEWAKQQNFPFRLLSDHLHKVAKLYDSFNEKYGFNKRTVFVIDKQGKIAYENLDYSVADNDDFNSLKAALKKIE